MWLAVKVTCCHYPVFWVVKQRTPKPLWFSHSYMFKEDNIYQNTNHKSHIVTPMCDLWFMFWQILSATSSASVKTTILNRSVNFRMETICSIIWFAIQLRLKSAFFISKWPPVFFYQVKLFSLQLQLFK